MHGPLRIVVESLTTAVFILFIVPSIVLHLWRSVKLDRRMMWRLFHGGERFFSLAFLVCLLISEPIVVHLYHFVPESVAKPLPDAALFAWLTANLFSAWSTTVGAFTRSYIRAMMYLPLVVQTFSLIFVSIDSLADGKESMATLLAILVALIGVWTIHLIPKLFQATKELLIRANPKGSNYGLARALTAIDHDHDTITA